MRNSKKNNAEEKPKLKILISLVFLFWFCSQMSLITYKPWTELPEMSANGGGSGCGEVV